MAYNFRNSALICALFFLVFCIQGQQRDIDLEIRLAKILNDFSSGNLRRAFSNYQKTFAKGWREETLPFHSPQIQYVLKLEKIIAEFGKTTQKDDGMIEAVFKKYGIMIDGKRLNHYDPIYQKEGLAGLWQNLSKDLAAGHFCGVTEHLRRQLAQIPVDQLASYDQDRYHSAKTQAQKLAIAGKAKKLYQFLNKTPYHLPANWITLGDLYLTEGEIEKTLSVWHRLDSWGGMTSVQRNNLDVRIALASLLNDDYLVYQKIRKKYQKSKTIVTIMGKRRRLSKFLVKTPKLIKDFSVEKKWHYRLGSPGHNVPVSDIDLHQGFENHNEYSFSSRSRNVYVQPLIEAKKLYCNFAERITCVDLDSGKSRWMRLLTRDSIAPYYLATGVLQKQLLCFVSYVKPKVRESSDFFKVDTYSYRPTSNALYCVDRNSGKPLWQWPINPKDPENIGTKIIFNTAPVFVEDKLFVGTTVLTGQVTSEVFCFQKDGKLLWRRIVDSRMPSSYFKKVSIYYGSGISAGYGIVYYCTNMGTIAALDVETGEIRWLAKYHDHFPQKYRLRDRKRPDWLNLPPVVKHKKVYITPYDSGYLFVYDAISGALQKIYPEVQENSQWNQLIGVGSQGKIFLAGKSEITTLQDRGKKETLWSCRLGTLKGLPMIGRKFIYALSNRGLHQISIESGKSQLVMTTYRDPMLWNSENIAILPQGVQNVLPYVSGNKEYLIMTGLRKQYLKNRKLISQAFVRIYQRGKAK